MEAELFKVRLKETGEVFRVFAVAPFMSRGTAIGGDFLIWTPKGWDWRPIPWFEPLGNITEETRAPSTGTILVDPEQAEDQSG